MTEPVDNVVDGAGTSGAAVTRSSRDPEELRHRIGEWLVQRTDLGEGVEIGPLAGTSATGMSSDTLLFDATYRDRDGTIRTDPLVARVAPSPEDIPVFPHYDLTCQFEVLRHVGSHSDVPVPTVRWNEPDASVLGAPFFVMDRVEGDVPPDVMPYTFGDNWLHDAEPAQQRLLQDRTVEVLARLHELDADHPALTRLRFDEPGSTDIDRHVAHTRDWYDFARRSGMRSRLVEAAFDRLEEHPPEGGATTLSWGDARIGNVMFRDFAPVAVLDWEMACLGPRELDLAWLIYSHMVFEEIAHLFDLDGMPDFLRPGDVVDHYERLTGHTCNDLDPYLTLAAIKFGIVFLRTGARQAHFGEISLPDDHDELLHNRLGLAEMLSSGTWRIT